MNVSGFPSCCGADILHNFDYDRPVRKTDFTKPAYGGIMVAITSNDQTTAIKSLKKLGFKPVRKFRHNRLTLWVLGGKDIKKKVIRKRK